ncbi:MAG: hypothetical protein U0V73_07985 [Acidimicrobiia bacterium]
MGEPVAGQGIIWCSWLGNLLFAATAFPVALGVDAMRGAAVAVAVTSFVVSLGVWVYAFGLGIVRSGRGDNVAVANLFFLQGSAPRSVRRHLLGSLVAGIGIAAVTASAEAFGVLVPMLPLGLAGLWGARHGTFPPRATGPRGRSDGGRAGA